MVFAVFVGSSDALRDVPVLRAPVEGVWRVVNSPGHAPFAFDLAAVDLETHKTLARSRLAHVLGRVSAQDSYSWSRPIRSPVSGTVVAASDGYPDRQSLNLVRDVATLMLRRPALTPGDIRPFAGNYVIIAFDDDYVFLAHMRMGSVRVREGDRIEAGQPVGEAGNSGLTLEPHLHLQLFDQVDDLLAVKAPPFRIDSFDVWRRGEWQTITPGILPKGKIVRFK